MKRRMLLKTGAAAIAVVAGSGVIWVNTRTPTKALAPWRDAEQGFGDVRLNCLAYAILAPSPHNRQPWRVELTGGKGMELYCDLDRRLPETDPFDRQITIGLGCFLELLRMAAANLGYKAVITPFPDGEPASDAVLDNRRIASITLEFSKVTKDPLFEQVLSRRSTKEAFALEQAVSADTLQQLTSIDAHHQVSGVVEVAQTAALKQTIYEGMAIEFGARSTLEESAKLMRFGKAQIERSPDGIDIGGPMMEAFITAGILTRESFSDPQGALVLDYLNRVKAMFETSKGFVWVASHGNSRSDQLKAGADYLKLNLQAGALGLAMQPVSQALQEYPAMAGLYQKVHKQLNVAQPARLQMLARIGYAGQPSPSPRWAVESVISVA